MSREHFVPATTLNLLAACWIQFENHDWFSHGPNPAEDYIEIPLPPGDKWHEPKMRVVRTRPDPTRSPGLTVPPTFVNTVTHWWDGSQIYGSDTKTLAGLRSHEDGKLIVGKDRLLPLGENGIDLTGFNDNWWTGLTILHTLFTLEHNAICDHLRAAYPAWDDERLFSTARLVNAALMAKIHTVDWTPAILGHPALRIGMNANWWGLVGERLTNILGRVSKSDFVSGIIGSPTDHHAAPFAEGPDHEIVEDPAVQHGSLRATDRG